MYVDGKLSCKVRKNSAFINIKSTAKLSSKQGSESGPLCLGFGPTPTPDPTIELLGVKINVFKTWPYVREVRVFPYQI
jgi:hypothetical protein